MTEINEFLTESARLVNADLDWLIPETGKGPRVLRDAIRWSLFGGGKRFRPALTLAVGRAFGSDDALLVRCGAAIEMLHTYSLIHDDLPSMDNDDLRRGRETCHRKFGTATAILAGDALQALAFQTIAEDKRLSDITRNNLISGLGRAAACMVVGQQLDLEAEGKNISATELEDIHKNKTGALIAFSATAGALIAGVAEAETTAVTAYGEKIGLLFQIVDDLLDVTGTTAELGKTAGKDIDAQKATYPSTVGSEATRLLGDRVAADSIESLSKLAVDTSPLKAISNYLASRTS
jgi:geranylgeranyl pyrophosphate synthase